jgi:hypothetical protein
VWELLNRVSKKSIVILQNTYKEEKMDNRTDDRNGRSNFLTRMFEIPAWLLLLIAIVAILASVLRITIPAFLWVLIVIVLIVIGWLSKSRTPIPGSKRELSDPDAPEYKTTLWNVPADVTSSLLKIDDRDGLRALDKDGVGVVLSVAGNLVFNDNDKLVTSFSSPISLTFNYTADDEQRRLERQEALRRDGTIAPNEEVQLMPVYLYSPTDKPAINIWKPFQNFRIDKVNRTITIELLVWGDQPYGPGTKP